MFFHRSVLICVFAFIVAVFSHIVGVHAQTELIFPAIAQQEWDLSPGEIFPEPVFVTAIQVVSSKGFEESMTVPLFGDVAPQKE